MEVVQYCMEEQEAQQTRTRIFKGLKIRQQCDNTLRRLLHEFDKGRGWAALGYSSLWKSLEGGMETEFGITTSYIYKLIKQGEVERQLEIDEPISGKTLSQLAKVDESQRKAVYEKARRKSGIRGVTEKNAKAAIKEVMSESDLTSEASALQWSDVIEELQEILSRIVKQGGPQKATILLADTINTLKEYQRA
jgi:transposase